MAFGFSFEAVSSTVTAIYAMNQKAGTSRTFIKSVTNGTQIHLQCELDPGVSSTCIVDGGAPVVLSTNLPAITDSSDGTLLHLYLAPPAGVPSPQPTVELGEYFFLKWGV